MHIQPDDTQRRFRDSPVKRSLVEVYCFLLTFWFWEDNNNGRKGMTLLIVLVWAALEVGAAFGYAELPSQFSFLRLFVGILVGRMWGIQFNNFAGLEFNYGEQGGDDNGDN